MTLNIIFFDNNFKTCRTESIKYRIGQKYILEQINSQYFTIYVYPKSKNQIKMKELVN